MEKTRYQKGVDIINEYTLADNKEISTIQSNSRRI